MKNLRNAGDYSVSIRLGEAFVGWSATDSDGNLLRARKNAAMGLRAFPPAETAKERRLKRSAKRNRARRRARLDALQSVFQSEMDSFDPTFFQRMRQTSLVPEDRELSLGGDMIHALLGEKETDVLKEFPTVWHLRCKLMEEPQSDLRLVYLGLHSILKRRGHFLFAVDAENGVMTPEEAIRSLYEAIEEMDAAYDGDGSVIPHGAPADVAKLYKESWTRSEKAKAAESALACKDKKAAAAISKGLAGLKVEMSNLIPGLEKGDGTSVDFAKEEAIEDFLEMVDGEAEAVVEALFIARSAIVLEDVLAGKLTVSEAMVASWEAHKAQLKDLKGLVRDYCGSEEYDRMFRGVRSNGRYDHEQLEPGTYTAYIEGESLSTRKGCTQEELAKSVLDLLSGKPGIERDERWARIEPLLKDGGVKFLPKQRSRTAAAIPNQLQVLELVRICKVQGEKWPFLAESLPFLQTVAKGRIPHYVGPLSTTPDPEGDYKENKTDPTRKFAWSVLKPGVDGKGIRPWNWREYIDEAATAEAFIWNLVGECTYLYGETVLPKSSLAYEEFCVLNELNAARWAEGDRDSRRFGWSDRERIVEELFKKGKAVSYAAVARWLKNEHGYAAPRVFGGSEEKGFGGKMTSWAFFCKVLGVDDLEDERCPLSVDEIEQIIVWTTAFGDKSITKRKVVEAFGDRLSESQIDAISARRTKGWGKLSRRLLCDMTVPSFWGDVSILEVMRYGSPLEGEHRRGMNLMEVLASKELGFKKEIEYLNKRWLEDVGELDVSDLPGSPAVKRGVGQALSVMKDIVRFAGRPPAKIVIELARDEKPKDKKGETSKKRGAKLKSALKAYKKLGGAVPDSIFAELDAAIEDDSIKKKPMYLYFQQAGACLYTGKRISLDDLASYEMDRIIPRSYKYDESLDNLALVEKGENRRKHDSLMLDPEIVRRNSVRWNLMRKAGLMSDKKLSSLERKAVDDKALEGFLNRQLVETRQIGKFFRDLCAQEYPDAEIVLIKTDLVDRLRNAIGLPKVREASPAHAMHDAYLAGRLADYLEAVWPRWVNGFNLAKVRKEIAESGGDFVAGKHSVIVGGFMKEKPEQGWDGPAEIEKVKKTLASKRFFSTYMATEQRGSFWDETTYSPKDLSHSADSMFPLREDGPMSDTALYGGKSGVRAAWFMLFDAVGKKGKRTVFFEKAPLYLVVRPDSEKLLEAYAEQIAESKGCHDVRMLKARVPFGQKVDFDGAICTIRGRTAGRNAVRSAMVAIFSPDELRAIDRCLAAKAEQGDEDRMVAFCATWRCLKSIAPKLAEKIAAFENVPRETVLKADPVGFASFMRTVLLAMQGNSLTVDTRCLGGTQNGGGVVYNVASIAERLVWIDQSPAGLFESRTTWDELVERAERRK